MQKSKKNMHMQKKMMPKEVGCGQEEMIRETRIDKRMRNDKS